MFEEGIFKPVNPEQERLVENAAKAVKNFVNLQPEEKVLFLTESFSNEKLANILREAVGKIGSPTEEIAIDKKTDKKTIKVAARESQVIFDLTVETEKTLPLYEDNFLKKNNYRMVAFADLDIDAFEDNGPTNEDPSELEQRLGRMEEVLQRAKGFKITSSYGTDLEVGLRPFSERRWFKENGFINQPGTWDNMPGGEIFTTPDETNVNGILVLPALDSTIAKEQGVDEFIKVTIRNGLISSIQGGRSAELLRRKLEEEARNEIKEEGGNPLNVYRIAELGFGANAKARSTAKDLEKSYSSPGVSIVETEKSYGTLHLAFGSSKHGEEGTEGFEDAVSHYDFVIPRTALTVEMFGTEVDFKNKKNGKKIINEGSLHFFD